MKVLATLLYKRIEGAYIFVSGNNGHLVASGGYTTRSSDVFGQVGWAIPV